MAVPLPDVAALVAPWRHTNRLGAHITVLVPFTSAPFDLATRRRFARRLSREPRFRVTLHALGWFDERVVYLQPDQEQRWGALASAAADALGRDAADAARTFHLTVAKGLGRDELAEAATLTGTRLPWTAVARSAILYERDRATGRWRTVVRAAFASPPATSNHFSTLET